MNISDIKVGSILICKCFRHAFTPTVSGWLVDDFNASIGGGTAFTVFDVQRYQPFLAPEFCMCKTDKGILRVYSFDSFVYIV